MTKEKLRSKLLAFGTLGECFDFRAGQECEIFKGDGFEASDQIIYVPDIDLNELREYVDHAVMTDSEAETDEIIDEIVSCCYTGNDFLEECGGDLRKAKRLFEYCDWQHPSSALPEIEDEDDL